ncbi:cytochrome c [Pelagibacterales bacterium SAG-MED46]|nr:cytochrome c [Pelagibacterales bacterium SAG-MED46]|tara:strand:+ start:96 stop:563 length:468 start_codon:yes stop_codon:yes gene_type:complete
MHKVIKHIVTNIGISLFLILSILIAPKAYSDQSTEDIIKGRKALFSKNYKTAKKVQSLSARGDFDEAKELMNEMSENYEVLLKLFPENSKEGFQTEALPIIWEEKENFDNLMNKASKDMIELVAIIEDADDIRGSIKKFMWSNCKACHTKYREEH